jgi:protochlorophyllide reductase
MHFLTLRPCFFFSISSGIGLYASKVLALANRNHRLILVARTLEKAELAKQQVVSVTNKNENSQHNNDDNILPMACDQSSIQSVKDFASNVRKHLSDTDTGGCIDVLCLNAATLHNSNEPEFTMDGLETTFQTNHLAPFLIVNLIHDLMKSQGRVIVTGSGLHYDCTFGDFKGIQDPDTGLVRTSFATVDGSDFSFKGAYATSKLCNVAFCMALNRKLEERGEKHIVANCFTPGLIPESGLFRNESVFRLMLFSLFARWTRMSSTIEWGGGALAWMATADEAGKRGGEYWKTPMGSSHNDSTYGYDFCPVPASPEAMSEANQEKLWEISSQLVGIPSNI